MGGKPKIKVTYWGGWGYKPKYLRLKQELESEFPDELEYEGFATRTITGYLEVEVNGKLIHSKKNGDGYIDSEAKLQKIIKAVELALK